MTSFILKHVIDHQLNIFLHLNFFFKLAKKNSENNVYLHIYTIPPTILKNITLHIPITYIHI